MSYFGHVCIYSKYNSMTAIRFIMCRLNVPKSHSSSQHYVEYTCILSKISCLLLYSKTISEKS